LATRGDVLGLLRLVDSYVLRRAICGIPTNTLNRTFQGFGRSIDKSRYLESAKAAFQMLDTYRRFPTDEEFKRDFVTRDIYDLTARRNYILRKLENHDRKEPVDVESFTIEHVMPQNERLSPAWRAALGPEWTRVQETYLHTIGNLTLTGYNSELSDRPFAEKRETTGGFRDSPIRLNKDLATLDSWNEDAIKARAARLAELAVTVWPTPHLAEATLASYRQVSAAKGVKSYSLADHPLLNGSVLALFESLRTRVLNLDPSVTEEILKAYIAYKTSTNFVDVVPRKHGLKLVFNMELEEMDDPESRCFSHNGTKYTGNGDVGLWLASPDQLDYTLFLVRQSFAKYAEETDG
jgi:predicted transport protein